MFFIVALLIWVSMNAYFAWRIETLPFFKPPMTKHLFTAAVVFLSLSYLFGRMLVHRGYRGFASFLEITGAVWMGVLFIFVTYLLFADILSFFGYFRTLSVNLRSAALAISCLLTIFAFIQGYRTPAVREEKIRVDDTSLAGLRIVQISDLHLGVISEERYLKRVVDKVNEQSPDIVLITGDIIDTDGRDGERFKELFRQIKADKGIYAVLGNHEYYHGAEKNPAFFEESGMALLRNRNVEAAKGLVIAGIDDLSAKKQFQNGGDYIDKALENRPEGFLVLMSHSPLEVEKASRSGVDLMLSGHCHNGQIWPFNFFSRMFYPYNYGRFEVGGMILLVTSGTGTWGPPMRLFRRNEMVKIEFVAR